MTRSGNEAREYKVSEKSLNFEDPKPLAIGGFLADDLPAHFDLHSLFDIDGLSILAGYNIYLPFSLVTSYASNMRASAY